MVKDNRDRVVILSRKEVTKLRKEDNVVVLSREQNRVLKLYNAGISQSEIARVVEISRQRVSQHVQRLRELELIDPK
jgi:DNA-binding CsgD family transcriptional regulator